MPQPLRKSNPIILPLNNSLITLPAPSNLSSWWNFGSLLGLCLLIQVLTGTFLAMHYIPHTSQAFDSIMHLSRDVSHGWLARTIHATGSSCFFMCLYLHIGRGIYYSSYLLQETWNIGVILLLLVMMTAFLGYVLPWGQMSFWGATVITNLLSAIPYIGTSLVQWIWGGYAVDSATLTRFFALHFITPFVTTGVTMTHFMFLHQTGSNNPLGMNSNPQKIPFHSYYSLKDLVGALILLLLLTFLALFHPNLLTDPENSIKANPLATPIHIMPEWYFLWAYAILRSIPNKLGGVMLMFIAIMMLLFLPFMHKQKQSGQQFHPPSQIVFWTLVSTMALLTWIGMKPVEAPFTWIGLTLTTMYFILYPLIPFLANTWESLYMN